MIHIASNVGIAVVADTLTGMIAKMHSTTFSGRTCIIALVRNAGERAG
jgi:hypothetical protein